MDHYRQIPKRLLIFSIKVYQYGLSPLLGPRCRFYPTCSEYSLQVIKYHGLLKGLLLSLKRFGKCHPWHPGGIDEPISTICQKRERN